MSSAHEGEERAPGWGRPHASKSICLSSPDLRRFKPIRMIGIVLILMTLLAVVPSVFASGTSYATITVTVLNVGASIENFVATPAVVTENEVVNFSFSVRNLGGDSNLRVKDTSRIEIYRGSNLEATRLISPPLTDISPGDKADFSSSWTFENSDNYRAVVTVDWRSAGYDSSSTEETTFEVVPYVPPVPPEVPVIPVEKKLEVLSFPPLIEIMPGESTLTSVGIKNPSTVNLSGLQVTVSASENWMLPAITATPATIDLEAGQTKFVNLSISVPAGVQPNDYAFRIEIAGADVQASAVSILRVKTPPPETQPVVMRRVDVDRENNITTVRLVVRNGSKFIQTLEITEGIPEELATSVSEIVFDTEPTEIIGASVVVKWVFESLQPHETRTIIYHLPKVFSVYADYLYWPIKQTTITYEAVELIQILELKSKFLETGGTGELTLMLRNNSGERIPVTARIRMPVAWTVVPDKASMELEPGESGSLVFYVTSPPYAEPATYMGEIWIYFKDQTLVRGVAISVLPSSSFLPGLLWLVVPLVVACVVAFAVRRWYNNRRYKKRRDPRILELYRQIEGEET